MASTLSVESHDFEIIDASDVDEDPTDVLHCNNDIDIEGPIHFRSDNEVKDSPILQEQQNGVAEKTIHNLFDDPQQLTIVQVLAKVLIFASMPFFGAMSIAVGLTTYAIQLPQTVDPNSDEQTIEHITRVFNHLMDTYRVCLLRVDQNLPSFVQE